jgi:hypothetical protein
MPSITITRPKTVLRDRARRYRIVVDGSEIAQVSHGETTAIEVAPGPHEVRAKIDWCTTPAAMISGDAQLTVQPGDGNAITGIFRAFFSPSTYLRLERVDPGAAPPP